jgi:hypothetical protein
MKFIPLVFASAFLIGCAHEKAPSYAPSSVALVGSIGTAVTKASVVKKYVKPEGQTAVKELETSLFEAQVNVGKYISQVDEQARELSKAQNEVVYWHSKQLKALRELLAWRGLALLTILSVVVYFGIKTSWKYFL